MAELSVYYFTFAMMCTKADSPQIHFKLDIQQHFCRFVFNISEKNSKSESVNVFNAL